MLRRWSSWLILLYPVFGEVAAIWTYRRMIDVIKDCVHGIDGGAGLELLVLGVAGLLSMSFVGLLTGAAAVGIAAVAALAVWLLNVATPPIDYCRQFEMTRP